MEKELGSEVIKATQSSLGKYVKRPPLTEKLLRKPPFRFLHDIVTSVLKTTGFFNGLFEDDELISDNVKDRESKILFLSKVISVISSTTEKSISAKPSKIVAGQEPEKTNELLQCLAYALDNKLSSDAAVQKIKDDLKTSSTADNKTNDTTKDKKKNDTKKLTSKSNEKLTGNKKDPNTATRTEKPKPVESKSKRKESEIKKNESPPKKTQNAKKVSKQSSLDDKVTQPPKPSTQKEVFGAEISKTPNFDEETVKAKLVEPLNLDDDNAQMTTYNELSTTDLNVENNLNSSYTVNENDFNSSLSSQDLMIVETEAESKHNDNKSSEIDEIYAAEKQIELNHQSNKDTNYTTEIVAEESMPIIKRSANVTNPRYERNASLNADTSESEQVKRNDKVVPPSLTRQNSEISKPQNVRPSSSRPGAPRLREKIENVIPDNDNLLLAKVNIIAEHSHNEEEEENSVVIVEDQIERDKQDLPFFDEHGHLVQQILDSQKEISNISGKTEIEWQFGAQKVMESANQEIEQLRYNIQALSRVANPLGKLLDHVQEDVEIMRQELQQWMNIYEEVSKEMNKQKTASEETLIPLQSKLKQLDMDIDEKRDKINDLKIMIHKNSTRITTLLSNGNVQ